MYVCNVMYVCMYVCMCVYVCMYVCKYVMYVMYVMYILSLSPVIIFLSFFLDVFFLKKALFLYLFICFI